MAQGGGLVTVRVNTGSLVPKTAERGSDLTCWQRWGLCGAPERSVSSPLRTAGLWGALEALRNALRDKHGAPMPPTWVRWTYREPITPPETRFALEICQ